MRLLQNLEELFADWHRFAAGFLAKLHQFAGLQIIAHDTIELGDALEGGLGRLFRRRFIRRIENDFEERSHVRLGEREALEAGRAAPARRRQRRENAESG